MIATAQQSDGPSKIELFEYPPSPDVPSLPDWQGWIESGDPDEHKEYAHGQLKTSKESATQAEFEQRLAEETRRSFEAGRERGRQEERLAERDSFAATEKLAEECRLRQRADLIENFAQERDRYLQAVEHEVVKLALAVAARILRREAQMDPLLLTGAVRVALGQLSSSTKVQLRVPPAELEFWTDAIALQPKRGLKPTVTSGEGMRLGDCVIETALGSVDLGIRSQLGEIERGFFDRAGGSHSSPATKPLANSLANLDIAAGLVPEGRP